MFDYYLKASKEKKTCKKDSCNNYRLDSSFCKCCFLYSEFEERTEVFLRLFNK